MFLRGPMKKKLIIGLSILIVVAIAVVAITLNRQAFPSDPEIRNRDLHVYHVI